MVEIGISQSESDLLGILQLQKANHKVSLTDEEIKSQGFVTVAHTLKDLKNLYNIEPHVIAKDGNNVVAYILAMTKLSAHDIPILIPMFELFKKISYQNKTVFDCNYMVVGQVCLSKDYRGMGLFDQCYDLYKKQFSKNYEFAITEIATENLRSMKAHQRIGFEEVYQYVAEEDGIEWSVVLWDWNR